MSESVADRIAEIEARRAQRAADHKRARDEQYLADLNALEALEDEAEPGSITTLGVDGEDGRRFSKGLPTFAAFRRPTAIEVKRFRDRTRAKNQNDTPNVNGALVELAEACLVYPTPEVFKRMLEVYPGIDLQGGRLAARLAVGKEEEDLKG